VRSKKVEQICEELARTVGDLQKQVEALRAELDGLKKSAPATAPKPSTTPPPSAPASPAPAPSGAGGGR